MRKLGKLSEDGKHYIIGNKFYSIKMKSLKFPKKKVYGLEYGFFLKDAVGEETEGKIEYVTEYLVELNNLRRLAW